MNWRYAYAVYGACLIAWSCLWGVLKTAVTENALHAFGAEARTAGVVAVSVLRSTAAPVAMLSASIALVMQLHRRLADEMPSATSTWLLLVTVPLGALLVGVLASSVSVITGVALGIPPSRSWRAVSELVTPGDLGYAIAHACGYAAVAGAGVTAVLPLLDRKRHWHVLAKLAVVWAVSTVGCVAVNLVWDLIFLADDAETGPVPRP